MSGLIQGVFYFVSDAYFQRFNDPNLTQNKGVGHARPCFYSFQDTRTGLFWMIPISSKVAKYRGIAQGKIQRYGFCNTIIFGEVLGQERAFLIQNMFPVTLQYVDSEYTDKNSGATVRVANSLSRQIEQNARVVLSKQRHGAKLIFPDVLAIERELLT